ncbi:MAG: TonB-dependent receptor [Kordiimonadaceae bacterium]|nr:TonB-dependent receptor [Kordiimonadaceae bacterium]
MRLVVLFGVSLLAITDVKAEDKRYEFDIPKQTVNLTLGQIAQTSKTSLLLPYDRVKAIVANRLSGKFSLEKALEIALANTGLKASINNDNVIVVSFVTGIKNNKEEQQMNGKFSRNILLGTTALVSAVVNGSVQAQDPASTEEAFEEIVVTGIRGGLQRAVDTKRNSISFVDAISSTELGRFPDENVAESLQRITGIQINRVRGEGSTVNIRGLPADFSRVQLNGRSVANSSFGFGGDAPGSTSRSFDFQLLPSEFVSSLEVVKSPTADMEEGGLSGTVNVRTARPLTIGEQRLALSSFASWESNSGKVAPRLSGLYSNTFADDRLGVLVAGAYTERRPETHRILMSSYRALNELDGGSATNSLPADFNGDGEITDTFVNVPRGTRTEILREDRKRASLAAVVEYDATDNLRLFVEGFYSKLNVESESLENLHLLFQATGDNFDPSGTQVTTIDGVDPSLPLFGNEFGLVLGLDNADIRGNSRTEQRKAETYSITAGGEYTKGPWTVNAEFNYSNSDQLADNLNLAQIQRFGITTILVPGAEIPGITYNAESDARRLDPNQGIVASVNGPFERLSTDEIVEGALDIEKAIYDNIITSVKFGVKFTDRQQFADGRTLVVPAADFGPLAGLEATTAQASGFNVAPYTQLVTPGRGDFLGTYSGDVPFVSEWIATDTLAVLDDFTTEELVAAGFINENQASWVDVKEKVFSAYAMANFEDESGRITGNFGVRLVHTKQDSVGIAPDLDNLRFLSDAGGTIDVPSAGDINVSRSYTEILPSLNVKFSLSDDLQLRFAASRTMARPSLQQLSPSTSVAGVSRIITANNPNLDPFIASNLDFGVEYYFGSGGALTVAFFHKDLATLVVADSSSEFIDLIFVSSATTEETVITEEFTVNSLVNDEGVTIKGFEIGYQQALDLLPAPFNNLGVQANYTFIDNSKPNVLTAASKHNFNISGWYESDDVAVRLSYTWRDRFVSQGLPFGGNGLGLMTEVRASLDANITYNVTDYASIVFEAINLLQGVDRKSTILGGLPVDYLDTGRRLMIGGRVSF